MNKKQTHRASELLEELAGILQTTTGEILGCLLEICLYDDDRQLIEDYLDEQKVIKPKGK
ncbi:hypothetical protein COB55_04010 [Candidatus Wolfebacteria bacterium]|nr:MAG: hypothetical protein COB55_04010 [Candidatus Wolfebacteria bacterium]